MEEEDYDGCDGADPRRRLDESILSLAEGILLRSIVVTVAGAAATAVRSTATTTMSMPTIDVIAVQWVGGLGWRQRQQRYGGGRRRRQCVRFLVTIPTPPTSTIVWYVMFRVQSKTSKIIWSDGLIFFLYLCIALPVTIPALPTSTIVWYLCNV